MKRLIKKITSALAATALAEIEGPEAVREIGERREKLQSFTEKVEEGFVTVAYAEAADYEDIKKALKAEKRTEAVRPDECQFGDNDLCSVET